MRKGPLYNKLATLANGEIDADYIQSIEEPSDFAKQLAVNNIPQIRTSGELLEYLVSVKRNENADLTDERRVSKTTWESTFIDINFIDIMCHVNRQIRESQFIRLELSYRQIFNSMSKF